MRLVSPDSAKAMYGVMFKSEALEVDAKKTDRRRDQIRKKRLKASKRGKDLGTKK